MPRKKITDDMKSEVCDEARSILLNIYGRWFGGDIMSKVFHGKHLPFSYKHFGERVHKNILEKIPSFRIKLGGWTATASKELNEISLNYYVWKKSPLVVKRLILIHETIHILGVKHSGIKFFTSTMDLMSLQIYLRLFGEDKNLKDFKMEIDIGIDNLTKKYIS